MRIACYCVPSPLLTRCFHLHRAPAAPARAASIFSGDAEEDSKHSSGEEKRGGGGSGSGSDSERQWVVFGGDQSEGSNELVRLRAVSSVCFSSLQAHLLMSAHPFREDDDEDLRPYWVSE
jgi:hypothetical protein